MSRSTTRNLIIVLVALVLVTAAFVVSGYFLLQKEHTLRTQLEVLKKDQEQESLLLRLEKTALDSKSKREDLRKPLLKQGSEIGGVLPWIEERAEENSIEFKTDTLREVVDKEARTEWVEAPVTFSGSEEDVERFIAILENLPYLSHFTSLTMTARSSTNWEVKGTLRILLFKPS
jgi:septation ring formation regulator EzrA